MEQVSNGGDTGSKGWLYYGLQVVANETAIFVAPQGLNGGWPNSGGSDIKFIDAMNNYINEGLCVEQAMEYDMEPPYEKPMAKRWLCSTHRPSLM